MNIILGIKNKINKREIYRIVFYGPSTTNMQHVFPAWPEIIRYVLRENINKLMDSYNSDWYIQTANRALDGAASRDLLDNSEEFVIKENPDIVFLSVSKNDAFVGIKPQETEANTKKLIDIFLKKQITVVFTTSVPSVDKKINDKIIPFVERDRMVAQFYDRVEKFQFIDFFNSISAKMTEKMYTYISERNEDFGFQQGDIDTVHFNRYGNAIVAGVILKECFGVNFDADKFLADLKDETKKYPQF